MHADARPRKTPGAGPRSSPPCPGSTLVALLTRFAFLSPWRSQRPRPQRQISMGPSCSKRPPVRYFCIPATHVICSTCFSSAMARSRYCLHNHDQRSRWSIPTLDGWSCSTAATRVTVGRLDLRQPQTRTCSSICAAQTLLGTVYSCRGHRAFRAWHHCLVGIHRSSCHGGVHEEPPRAQRIWTWRIVDQRGH